MPDPDHASQTETGVPCVVLTISDTRTPQTDQSGLWIREALIAAGHRVVAYAIIPDEPDQIEARLADLSAKPDCRVVLLTGGTGLSPRDSTCEAVTRMFDKRLDGFGELFRSLSYAEIGAAAMLSRATAGTVGSTVIFAMPGSTGAVRLAMEKLILPQLGHIVWLLGH